MQRQDGYYNTVIGHGMERNDPFTRYKYGVNRYDVADTELDDLYTYNGIANKVISAPADEAVRTGFNLKDGEAIIDQDEQVASLFEDLNANQVFAQALKWDRLYGGCAILMMIEDGGKLDEPLNENRMQRIERLEVFEAPEVTIHEGYIYTDPTDPRYGKPQYYTLINDYGSSMLVHESRLIMFMGGEISKRRRRVRRGFGGRELDRIRDELTHYNNSLSLAVMALSRMSQGILKLNGMESLLQSDFGELQVKKRLQLIDMARHMMNTIAIDTEDEYDQKNLTLSGISDIISQFEMALSAVSGIPSTVLFGRSPDGLNATGQSDLEGYYNLIGRIQQTKLRPALLRLISLLEKCSAYNLQLPSDYTIAFKPLWNASEKEVMETAKIKAEAKVSEANAAKTYFDMGVLDISEIRESLKQDSEYQIDDSLDKELLEPPNEVVDNESNT